jgi:electron transport complex protein RnfB
MPPSAAAIDALLPQTQCTRCGYGGCAPYAEAIARGAADINRCPPGGAATIAALAALTGREPRPLDPAVGAHGPLLAVAIDETRCIGCTLCIAACPADAIIGAPKRMHAVLPSLCTGCELCVPPCPVDCIVIAPAGRAWTADDADAARERYRARTARVARSERIASRSREAAATAERDTAPEARARAQRRDAIAAALVRARARRGVPAG